MRMSEFWTTRRTMILAYLEQHRGVGKPAARIKGKTGVAKKFVRRALEGTEAISMAVNGKTYYALPALPVVATLT